MSKTRDRIFLVSGSARFHRHGEQWHESLPMMKDGRAGHSGLTERPILNELKNTTVLDMAISLVSPRAKVNMEVRAGTCNRSYGPYESAWMGRLCF